MGPILYMMVKLNYVLREPANSLSCQISAQSIFLFSTIIHLNERTEPLENSYRGDQSGCRVLRLWLIISPMELLKNINCGKISELGLYKTLFHSS
jgi:hypothetical protein